MAQLRPDQPPPTPTPQPPAKQPNTRLRLALLLAGVAIYVLFLATPLLGRVMGGSSRLDVPYSVLKAQAADNNIKDLTLQGQQATGDFNTAVSYQGVSNTAFTSTTPEASADPSLYTLLDQNHVSYSVKEATGGWTGLLINFLPFVALIALWVWILRRSGQATQGIFSFGRSRARIQEPGSPKTTFNDVAGVEQAQYELQEIVDFLREPQKFQRLGGRMPKGVLLIGTPGTGKTLLARAVAGEAGVPFFSISASEFVEMFVGVGASRVRDLFEQAKAASPAIVFIDEMDAVGRRRGAGLGAVNDEREQTLNQLLVEMDGFDERNEVIVVAATNRPDVLDPALLRPGRFDRQVVVGLPDRQGREGILRIHTKKLRLSPDVDLSTLSRSTTGSSGADLANLCNEAALISARHNRTQVVMADFEEAQDKILLGGARPALMDARERLIVAYHESGH